MERLIILQNYFSQALQVNLLVFNSMGQIENTIPMTYEGSDHLWYVNVSEYYDESIVIYYQFMVNKSFRVNQLHCDYEFLGGQLVSINNPDDRIVVYESDFQTIDLYTFTIYNEQIRKQFSFTLQDQLIHLWTSFNNTTNVFVLIEWLDPQGDIYSLHECIVEAGTGIQSFLLLQKDDSLIGRWTINLYSNGHVLDKLSFYLHKQSAYVSSQSLFRPTIDQCL